MARGFFAELAAIQRERERALKAEIRRQQAAHREAERARRAYERAQAAEEKERRRLYVASQEAEVNLRNEQVEGFISELQNLLGATLHVDDFLDWEALKEEPDVPPFQPGGLEVPAPAPELQLPPPPSGLGKLFGRDKHEAAVAEARQQYERAVAEHASKERQRETRLAQAKSEYDSMVAKLEEAAAEKNREIDRFRSEFEAGKPQAVTNYFDLVLQSSSYPDGFPQHTKIAYVPESKQLVVEYELPTFDVVPEVKAYKYVKTKDEVTSTPRPATQRRALYASLVSQIALRTLHELFEADRSDKLETIVFNGFVQTVDKATGKPIKPYLVTLRTTKDVFQALDLAQVEPQACLKGLNAAVSKSPAELAPVRPVLEFNMVDPRFVEESDVLSTLDQRPNLMELTPSEFESLITNLFEKMGLETRMTQASRDGGVDCVAYDPRPIFGGKVVIQAKRYRNTVGVSAVRDLYGTMQNEGASKGILVTTSGYGKAAFEFAEGKPLELLSGSNLLYLLAENAGMEAKIEPPEDWLDPVPDSTP